VGKRRGGGEVDKIVSGEKLVSSLRGKGGGSIKAACRRHRQKVEGGGGGADGINPLRTRGGKRTKGVRLKGTLSGAQTHGGGRSKEEEDR